MPSSVAAPASLASATASTATSCAETSPSSSDTPTTRAVERADAVSSAGRASTAAADSPTEATRGSPGKAKAPEPAAWPARASRAAMRTGPWPGMEICSVSAAARAAGCGGGVSAAGAAAVPAIIAKPSAPVSASRRGRDIALILPHARARPGRLAGVPGVIGEGGETVAQTERGAIEAHLAEARRFPPPAAFAEAARVRDTSLHEEAERDPAAFWGRLARQEISWFREPTQTLDDANPPFYKWFADGTLNVAYNCLDRHVEAGGGDKLAYKWIGEPGDERTFTYAELLAEVERAASALKALGVGKGDRVAIYLGMVPELPIAMLACARIGAPHSVVFGGFSASSLAGRIQDAECKVVITADGAWRRGNVVPLKDAVDEAVAECPSVQKVLVVRRTANEVAWDDARDVWWHDAVAAADPTCPPEEMGAEDILYLLYTSGTTAKPKGIVHTSGGYLLGTVCTQKWVFDLRPDDVYWCTADCGWVTGHSYVVYGPLANHTTGIIYEGTPEYPTWARHWEIVERERVSIYYTAPTAIRALIKAGEEWVQNFDLSSLRAARDGRRADQPRGLGLVPGARRRGPLPDRRHLVADGDGRDHDRPAARA